jgi:hypothetical protein
MATINRIPSAGPTIKVLLRKQFINGDQTVKMSTAASHLLLDSSHLVFPTRDRDFRMLLSTPSLNNSKSGYCS